PDADGGLNDNTMHPGHELSDLRNVHRQPAGEAVVHYGRFAHIPSFPDHPEAEPAAPASSRLPAFSPRHPSAARERE
ncbi:hypothetical protein ACC870_38835, partial [Rhizobium ruizarguesonis]